MSRKIDLRSLSFDTSFLLKMSTYVDDVIKILMKDNIKCVITSTVLSELEQLKIWGRISKNEYKIAFKRWKRTNATIIDFKNHFLSNEFGKTCMRSMEKQHGVKPNDIVNDCNILVISMKNGVDVFLSEDFHFTSRITKKVIYKVKSIACKEYHLMCSSFLYNIDSTTFLKAYENKKIDIDIIEKNMRSIKKPEKRISIA
jgi:rRNA-processing protein FCF1